MSLSKELQNANPKVYHVSRKERQEEKTLQDYDNSIEDSIDSEEIFELIRHINDPEHPLTLEQLNVVQVNHIQINHLNDIIQVEFTPTIPHCSMATLIGLSIKVRLIRSLSPKWKIDVMVRQGTHQSEQAVNKQLQDKERVAAALENRHLLEVVNQCLSTTIDKL